MIRTRVVLIAFLWAHSSGGMAFAEQGDARARAGAHYQRGLSFVDREQWAEALREFEEAMAIDPHQATLFNLAHCLNLLGRHVEAARAFQEHLDRFGSQLRPERRQEVVAQLSELASRVGRFDPRITGPRTATVLIDGEELGVTPLRRPIIVGPGSHVVVVRALGFQDTRRAIEIRGGETSTLEIVMQPHIADTGPPPTMPETIPVSPPPTESPLSSGRSSGLVTAGWVLTGLCAVVLGTGIALIGAASSQYSDWESMNRTLEQQFAAASGPTDVEAYWEDVRTNDDRHDLIQRLDTGGWILVGTGVTSLVAGVVLLIVGYRSRPDTQMSLAPRPGGISFGLSWGGSER